ncbi:hypothetical protein AC249_AIPGENE3888 [Exaiptasia diaphana]|nr:hypothetical protein AC249_AIPGENE3888 [Exaiptasia diaphana]
MQGLDEQGFFKQSIQVLMNRMQPLKAFNIIYTKFRSYLTIRPRGRVDYELTAHEDESARPNGLLARSPRGREV